MSQPRALCAWDACPASPATGLHGWELAGTDETGRRLFYRCVFCRASGTFTRHEMDRAAVVRETRLSARTTKR